MSSQQADQTYLSGLTVLYVEDNPGTQQQVANFLRYRVGRVCLKEDGSQGLECFRRERPDIVVIDIIMLGTDGLELIEAIRAEAPGMPVIVTTACLQTQVLLRAMATGVNHYLLKPLHSGELEAALLACSHNLRVAKELVALQKQKLDQLQAQHVQTLGVLAGGMAHDYNNLLQALMTNVALAKRVRNNPYEVFNLLDSAESAWDEIRELGDRLRLLHQERAPFYCTSSLESDLRDVLEDSAGSSACALRIVLADDLPKICFNRLQMKTVLKILADNAFEAMAGCGTLRVEGKVHQINQEDALPLAQGDYLHLSFSDQGPGIHPDILPNMFSPYASTKERGSRRGMGLSLAMAQAIVRLHAGLLLAENAEEGGATLHLYLPIPGPGEGVDSTCPIQTFRESAQAS